MKDPEDVTSPVLELRFKSVLFGATASPFLLQATLDYHISRSTSPIKDVIRKGFYVDNFLGTSESHEELKEVYLEANQLLEEANMPLQQWTSNSVSFKNIIKGKEEPLDEINVLGLNWNTEDDHLNIKTPQWSDAPLTKRNLLGQVSSVFDPLGLLTPLTVRGRLLVREAWKGKYGWDTPLPEEIRHEWEKLKTDLGKLEELVFPRSVISTNSPCSLHVFCDASSKAYGAVAYVVQGESVGLLTSRSRVSPLKERSLPQLELTALLLGARLVKYAIDTLDQF